MGNFMHLTWFIFSFNQFLLHFGTNCLKNNWYMLSQPNKITFNWVWDRWITQFMPKIPLQPCIWNRPVANLKSKETRRHRNAMVAASWKRFFLKTFIWMWIVFKSDEVFSMDWWLCGLLPLGCAPWGFGRWLF